MATRRGCLLPADRNAGPSGLRPRPARSRMPRSRSFQPSSPDDRVDGNPGTPAALHPPQSARGRQRSSPFVAHNGGIISCVVGADALSVMIESGTLSLKVFA